MKQGIHPNYQQITFTCSCGAKIQVGSTSNDDISVEICSECHPFFTGKQKLVDTAGRLDRFQKRQAIFEEGQKKIAEKKAKKEGKSTDDIEEKSKEEKSKEALEKAKKAA